MTQRKAFNFFRSYYDVFNELEKDKDKLQFVSALLKRQFEGTEPNDLNGMAKFAYISQKFNIDSQVEGFENKTKSKLSDNQALRPPTQGDTQGGTQGGTVQGKEEGKEEGKDIEAVYFPKSSQLDEAFKDYLKLRSKHKFTMTERAINSLVKKLRELSGGEVKKALDIIDAAIVGKWKSFYTLDK